MDGTKARVLRWATALLLGGLGTAGAEKAANACTSSLQCLTADVLAPFCATSGPKAGTCVQCVADVQCGGGNTCSVDVGECLCVCVGASCSNCDGGVTVSLDSGAGDAGSGSRDSGGGGGDAGHGDAATDSGAGGSDAAGQGDGGSGDGGHATDGSTTPKDGATADGAPETNPDGSIGPSGGDGGSDGSPVIDQEDGGPDGSGISDGGQTDRDGSPGNISADGSIEIDEDATLRGGACALEAPGSSGTGLGGLVFGLGFLGAAFVRRRRA